jgi:hypothetical protein
MFTPKEETLLQKGLKYNLHHKPKNWLCTLALEAENAITLLPAPHHSPLRYLVARNIEQLYQQQQNTDKTLPHNLTTVTGLEIASVMGAVLP